MYCPTCRVEYRPGFTTCIDCLLPLTPELPPEPELEAPPYVTILQTSKRDEFAIAKSLLTSAGIDYVGLGEELLNATGWGPISNPVAGPARLLVPQEDAADALAVLSNAQDNVVPASELDSQETLPDPAEVHPPALPSNRVRGLLRAVVLLLVAAGYVMPHVSTAPDWDYSNLVIAYVERQLDLEAALIDSTNLTRTLLRRGEPPWDLKNWAAGLYGKALVACEKYDYTGGHFETALIRARLAITLAEFGDRENASKALEPLSSAVPPNEKIAALAAQIRQAYDLPAPPTARSVLNEPASPEDRVQQADIPPGWSADILDVRWSEGVRNLAAVSEARGRIQERGRRALYSVLPQPPWKPR